MKTNKLLKLILSVIILVGLGLTLSACKTTENYYGPNVDPKKVYATSGEVSVTYGEVYNEFKLVDKQALQNLISQKILAKEIAQIDLDNAEHKEFLVKKVNKSLYGFEKNAEETKKEFEKNPSLANQVKEKTIPNLVNSLYTNGIITDRQGTIDTLVGLVGVDFENYPKEILLTHKLELAKRLYAKPLFDKEVVDDTKDIFVKEKDVLQYFKDHNRKEYDLKFFFFPVLNNDEFNTAARHAMIKRSNDDQFYVLPDVNKIIKDGTLIDFSAEGQKYFQIYKLLKEKGLEGKITSKTELNEYELYNIYYDGLQIKDVEKEPFQGKNKPELIFEKLIEINNMLNKDNKLTIVDASEFKVQDKDGKLVDFVQKHAEITKEHKELMSYAQNSLGNGVGKRRYTVSPVTKDGKSYVVFLIEANQEELVKEIDKDVYDKEKDEFLNKESDKTKAIIEKITKKLQEDKFNQSFIDGKYNELLSKTYVKVSDNVLYINYKLQNKSDKRIKLGTDKTNLVEITFDKSLENRDKQVLTFVDYYDYLNKIQGQEASTRLLFEKIMSKKYLEKVDKEKQKNIRKNLKAELSNFANGAFGEQLPPSIGRKNYLLIKYGTPNFEEAVTKAINAVAVQEFYKDYETHFSDIYAKFSGVVKDRGIEKFNLSVSHLLISVDADFDGKPDKFDEIPADLKNHLIKLVKVAYEEGMRGDKNKSSKEFLKELAEEFEKSTRILSHNKYEYNKQTHVSTVKESKFAHLTYEDMAELKFHGFKLKFEDLGTITPEKIMKETSNFVPEFNVLMKKVNDSKPVSTDASMYNPETITGESSPVSDQFLKDIHTEFGYHIILVNSKSMESNSAMVSSLDSDVTEKVIVNGKELSYLNSENHVSADQIHIKMAKKEYKDEKYLPSKVIRALNDQFSPLFEKYNSSGMRFILENKVLGAVTYDLAGHTDRFTQNALINERTLYGVELAKASAEFKKLWEPFANAFK